MAQQVDTRTSATPQQSNASTSKSDNRPKKVVRLFEVRGQVTDNNGNPVGEANISIKGSTQTTRSGRGGFYHISELPAGEITLVVRAMGMWCRNAPLFLESVAMWIHINMWTLCFSSVPMISPRWM